MTMAIRRLAKRLETDKALAKKVKRVERMLFVKGLLPGKFDFLTSWRLDFLG